MRVVFDISVLGLSHQFPSSRAGIARVVEHLAQGIANASEIDLAFFAGEGLDSIAWSQGYLESRADWPSVPLLFAYHTRARKVLREWRYDPDTVSAPGIRDVLRSGLHAETLGELRIGRRVARRLALWADPLIQYRLPPSDWARLNRAHVFHSPALAIPEVIRKVKGLRVFLTVNDVLTLIHPEYFPASIIQLMARTFESLRQDDWIITISESTKNDACERLHLDPARVFVTPLAASSELFYECRDRDAENRVREKYDLPEGPFFLTLNTLEPRKNMVQVIRAFAKLMTQERLTDCSLVLAGPKGWLHDSIFEELAHMPEISKRVHVIGFVANEDLAALYSSAIAFVYPSYYEGFGLPPLEAMQCGTPVITSNTSSLPEVVGDAGIMVNPTDTEALSQAMFELYKKPDLRLELSVRGLERAKQFTWQRCVAETIKAYKVARQ